ncbi:hypothetical protein Tco_0359160 [Tanacetum coccineum]
MLAWWCSPKDLMILVDVTVLPLIRFYTSTGNPVKEILLKLNLLDHRILKDGHGGNPDGRSYWIKTSQDSKATCSYLTDKIKEFQRSFRHSDTERLPRSDEVLLLKNFKKDVLFKLSRPGNNNSMSMSVQKSQVHKTTTRSQDDDKRLCSVDDLKEVQEHIQVKLNRTSSSLKSKITTSCS